ncbi:YjbE family putative metal transport protein [Sulfurisoma sediminicola]|uniref:YjbE family integral membrane protein n=1 Tax=Sulfurisoma sediminicola TaxID=1381557 RepID=A0A497XEC4_9PROT|nr:YjbE family putative metal transport protein [Sulfurisoma sediminicola]RLJ65340.1 YjbE family integral membrane protein [Sulfurisoma sediminicola]
MEFGSPAFWVALLQIIGADIVLSGDNAVVIALATRSLPQQQQRVAIFWGTFAAVAMRVTLTVVAVALLKLPALKLVGALMLLWIAVQLLLPEEESSGEGMVTGSLGAAIRTILLADLVMSVDNIIAIAAAAKGSILLLVIGLAVSIPLVIFTSTILLKVMERYPVIITAGAALLGWVAGEMAVHDPLVADWVKSDAHWLLTAAPVGCAVVVVAVGKFLAFRAEAGEEKRPLAEVAEAEAAAGAAKETSMHKLLLPIDGSAASLRAVERLLELRAWYREPLEIHLLNVQRSLHKDVGQFVAAEDVRGFFRDESEKELAEARARLDRAGVPYRHHAVVGDLAAEAIAHFAREHGIGQILMCTHGRSAVADLLLGSVAKGVLQHSDVPVILVR